MKEQQHIRVVVPDDDDEDSDDSEEEKKPAVIYRGQRTSQKMLGRADLRLLISTCLSKNEVDKLSAHTLDTYATRLGVLRERFHDAQKKPRPDPHDHRWMSNHVEVIKFIDSEWSSFETRKVTIESLICVTSRLEGKEYEEAVEQYRVSQTDLAGQSDNRYITQAMTDAERKKWIEWEELLSKSTRFRNAHWPRLASKLSWSEEDFRLFQELLILSVYVISLPPLRLEWSSVKVKDHNRKTDNYIDYTTSPGRVHMMRFKTAKFYKENVLDISDPVLWSMLKRAKEIAEDSEYLFLNSLGEPYISSSAFGCFVSKTFSKVVGKAIGASMVRKIYISYMQEKAHVPLTREVLALETLSRQMGHSPAQQSRYRRVDEGDLSVLIEKVEQMRVATPGHTRSVQSTMPMNHDRLMGGVKRDKR